MMTNSDDCNCEVCRMFPGWEKRAAPAPEAKPTRVEVGQRWRFESEPYEVVEQMAGPFPWRIRWDSDGSDMCLCGDNIVSDTFLGYAKPAGPPFSEPLPPIPPDQIRALERAIAAPPRPIRREVSQDGWSRCRWDSNNPYPFESYAFGWEGTGDTLTLVRAPAPKRDPGRAETWGDLAGMAAAALVTRP